MSHFSKVVFACLLLTSLPFFSACTSLTSFYPTQLTQDVVAEEESDEPTDEERRYLELESQAPLDEELAALEKLGPWEAHSSEPLPELTQEQPNDFPVIINKQVQFYLDQYQNRQRKTFRKWLSRSSQYRPLIEEQLKNNNLPTDLLYLAMIESGFNPSAYSYAHAAGLWQFIRGTGRNYGLTINSWVDERRNPEKATKAAINYLSTLYNEFGDWYLAVAAYNAGEGKVEKAIKKYNSRDFWELANHKYFSVETKSYVPKLIAAIIIGRDPARYGFTHIAYKQPVEYDLISLPPRTDLAAVAVTAETSVKELRKLNNELRKNHTPPGKTDYILRIPTGTRELVAQNLPRLHPVITTAFKTHKVRKGDTITKVCRKYKINKTILLKANDLRTASLKKGQRLRIPYRATKYVLLKEGETPETRFAKAGKDGQMILHTIKRGETLSQISKQYNVPVKIIKQWNEITNVRRIRAGNHIALFLDAPGFSAVPAAQVAQVQPATPKAQKRAIVILKESNKVAASSSTVASTVPDKVWYKVRNGDSLWTIARKFQVSARQIRSWNNLPNNLIHPGTRLVVKKG